jgi:two-component system phosphate regulon response regulator PhoB
MKILIVDDDADLLSLVAFALSQAGYVVVKASDVPEALRVFAAESPDLAILDINLPSGSGFDVCRAIRQRSRVPIMMLTVRNEEGDLVKALDLGADDYLTKPFSPRELLARINAVLRRSSAAGAGDTLEAGGLVLDTASHRVTVDGQTVQLGPTEYRLLRFFMENPERVYSRSQVLDRVWGGNVYVEERTVDVHIRRLRKALEPFGRESLVQTVRGAGYRFSTQSE